MLHHRRHFADNRRQPTGIERGRTLAQAIVDTIREPLLVLDKELRVVAASRTFYLTFRVSRQETQGQLLNALGNGQWDIPGLRVLLERIGAEHPVLDDYEVEQEFPRIGHRVMLLNARKMAYGAHGSVLLAIEDVTARRAAQREVQELLHQKDLLLEEMQHRIANSLQIIASILLLKARTVQSHEIRSHLQDAHRRVLSVAAVQHHLVGPGRGEAIAVAPYLSKLCATLGGMISNDHVSLEVASDAANLSSTEAVSIGLIATEGVLNAVKHAFGPDKKNGWVVVSYKVHAAGWKLSIADNGTGKRKAGFDAGKPGLGTSIIKALAEQLNARVDIVSSASGTTLSVTRNAVVQLPHAA